MIRPCWPAPPAVAAACTTRAGGVSPAPYDSFNLADHVGDDPIAVARNRRDLRTRLALPAEPRWLQQVHGCQVVEAGSTPRAPADACVGRRPGEVCAVLTADCLPVLLCDRDASVVAAAHAGWRGLAAGVLEASVAALGVAPQRVLAWLGPAIGAQVFEVGDEVRAAFLQHQPQAAAAFRARDNGRWLADIYQLARLRLRAAGVEAIHGGGDCTYSDPARFFSYRRDGTTGRMASLIWLQ